MCKVISVANIKGGVAKTTTAANLGVGLVKKGKRVLLVDLDPQGSLSLGLGIRNNKELPYTVSTVIQKVINEIEISEGEGIIHNDEGVDILPSNHSLRTVEQQLDEVMSKEHILEEYIDGIRDRYDYIIIDCNPGVDNGLQVKRQPDGRCHGKHSHKRQCYTRRMVYKIKVLNTINFARSMHYNPFAYIRSEKDILKLVNTIIVNTKGEGQQSGEDFWVKAEKLLYTAYIGFIWYEAPEKEQNFSMLIDMIDASEAREDDESFKNPVDLLFDELEAEKPNHFAVRQYKKYKLAAGKTAKSILISCGARLAPFDIAELRELTSYDELELDKLGTERTALFVIMRAYQSNRRLCWHYINRSVCCCHWCVFVWP